MHLTREQHQIYKRDLRAGQSREPSSTDLGGGRPAGARLDIHRSDAGAGQLVCDRAFVRGFQFSGNQVAAGATAAVGELGHYSSSATATFIASATVVRPAATSSRARSV